MNDIELHAEYSALLAYLMSMVAALEEIAKSPSAKVGVLRREVVAVGSSLELLTEAIEEQSVAVSKRLGVALL